VVDILARFDGFSWLRNLSYDHSQIYRNLNYSDYGFSVRCVKDPPVMNREVTTAMVTEITYETAASGGNVIFDGFQSVNELVFAGIPAGILKYRISTQWMVQEQGHLPVHLVD